MPDPSPTGEYQPVPIHQAVRRFEKAFRAGKKPAVEDYVAGDGPDRWHLILELVHSDLELRLRAGEPVALADYLTRFPGLAHFPNELAAVLETEVGFHIRAGRAPVLAEYEARHPHLGRRVRDVFRRVGSAPPDVPGYEVGEKLGEGGMGTVYRARQALLRRDVALKVIRGDLLGGSGGDRFRARFRREAEAVAAVNHPQVVQVYEYGEHAGDLFLAMELVDGPSLQKKLDRDGVLGPRAAAELARALATAVHAVHGRGIVHRDLKPDNVLLAADGSPKVTDFGLARPAEVADGRTRAGVFVGTPEYSSPEQAAMTGEDPTPRTDVYGLGAVLYACLTGRPPFPREDVLRTLEKVRTQDVVPVRGARPDCPRDLETICAKCLEKEPGKRYESAAALADDLRRWLAGEPILARPVGPPERAWKWVRRNRAVSGAMLAVVLALGAGAAAALWQAGRANRKAQDAADAAGREAEQRKLAETRADQILREQTETRIVREQAERNRIRGYVQVIGRSSSTAPEYSELFALESLAVREDDRAKLLFLEEALADPEAAFRVAGRSERVVQALVGLSLKRREMVLAALDRAAARTHREPKIDLCIGMLRGEFGLGDWRESWRVVESTSLGHPVVLSNWARLVTYRFPGPLKGEKAELVARALAAADLPYAKSIQREFLFLELTLRGDPLTAEQQELLRSAIKEYHDPRATSATLAAATQSVLKVVPNCKPSQLGYLADKLTVALLETDTYQAIAAIDEALAAVLNSIEQADRNRYQDNVERALFAAVRGVRFNPQPVGISPFYQPGRGIAFPQYQRAFAGILVRGFHDVPVLVELLRDPHCVGEYQAVVLGRLEDLAFLRPDLPCSFAGLGSAHHPLWTVSSFVVADAVRRAEDRKFRSVSDAAAWVQQHHPSIDLDQRFSQEVSLKRLAEVLAPAFRRQP